MESQTDESQPTEQPVADITVDDIKGVMSRYPYPIGSLHIARQLNVNKKVINKILYREKNKEFEELPHTPPLWKSV